MRTCDATATLARPLAVDGTNLFLLLLLRLDSRHPPPQQRLPVGTLRPVSDRISQSAPPARLELLLVAEAELDSAVGQACILIVVVCVVTEVEACLLVLVGEALSTLGREALECFLFGCEVGRSLSEAVVQEGGRMRTRVKEREERLLALQALSKHGQLRVFLIHRPPLV